MSSPGFSATLDLPLKPSLRAVQVVFMLHAAAIVLSFLAAPPRWPGLLLSLLILVSWRRLRRPAVAGYGAAALSHLIWHAGSDAWRIETAAGQADDAELRDNTLIWPGLIVLNFRLKSGAKRTRVLLGDETDADSLRRLRARLLAAAAA
ncbi:MAG: hypothetical protein NVS9B10_12200 [Nevskia sp.]